MVDKKLIWNRVREASREDIKRYEDALYISQQMLELADKNLRKISGMVLI